MPMTNMNLDKATQYDYSDTSTARELIYGLSEQLRKAKKLNNELIDYVIRVRNGGSSSRLCGSLLQKFYDAVEEAQNKILDQNDNSSTDEQ